MPALGEEVLWADSTSPRIWISVTCVSSYRSGVNMVYQLKLSARLQTQSAGYEKPYFDFPIYYEVSLGNGASGTLKANNATFEPGDVVEQVTGNITVNATTGSPSMQVRFYSDGGEKRSQTLSFSAGTLPFEVYVQPASSFTVDNPITTELPFNVYLTKSDNSYSDTLVMKVGSTQIFSWNFPSGTGSGTKGFTNSVSEILKVYNAQGSALSSDATFTLTTYNGNTQVGSSSKTTRINSIGTANVKVGGSWKKAVAWVKVGGVWEKAVSHVRVGSTWKRGR